MNAFDRQLASVVLRRVGPSEAVDDAAIFTAITAIQSPKWRFQSMFSVTKFVVAGAIVALFGGFLFAGVVTQPVEDAAPAAVATGRSCPEAGALASVVGSDRPATSTLAVPVHASGFLDEQGVSEDNATISEEDGYARITFLVEQTVEVDDPRLSGTLSGEVTAHFLDDLAAVAVGDVRIDNDEGSWVGRMSGNMADETEQHFIVTLGGEGAYAGCAASLHLAEGGDMVGVIYPSEAVAVID
jgi:hypothetical protein